MGVVNVRLNLLMGQKVKVFLYRISLSEKPVGPLLEGIDDTKIPDRESELRRVFSSRFEYSPRRDIIMTHFPIQEDSGFFSGVLARWHRDVRPGDETNPFVEREANYWTRAAYFLNVNDDEQVLGVELNRNVASSQRSMVAGLMEGINSQFGNNNYKFDAFSVNHEEDFWTAVRNHPAPITNLRFDFVAPNGPNTTEETRKAMKELHKETNSSHIAQEFRNDEGIDLSSDAIESRQSYAATGGGDTIAKSGKKTVYNSASRVRDKEVSETLRPMGQVITGLADALRGILER